VLYLGIPKTLGARSVAKLGQEYNLIVADVMGALHPGASIEIGEWVEGPDGEREVDVAIRGVIDGQIMFILVECKDWKRPVDVKAIDELDSKRTDLGADRTMLASNSGFSSMALRKAERKSIGCVAALAGGNDKVRFRAGKVLFAKARGVKRYASRFLTPQEFNASHVAIEDITYQGLNLTAWLREKSLRLTKENEDAPGIMYEVAFSREAQFRKGEEVVPLLGVQVFMECDNSWVCQEVQQDVSLGTFDFLKSAVMVPPNQSWSIILDQQAWKPLPEDIAPPDFTSLEPNSFEMHMILYRAAFQNDTSPAPALDPVVIEEATILGPIDWKQFLA